MFLSIYQNFQNKFLNFYVNLSLYKINTFATFVAERLKRWTAIDVRHVQSWQKKNLSNCLLPFPIVWMWVFNCLCYKIQQGEKKIKIIWCFNSELNLEGVHSWKCLVFHLAIIILRNLHPKSSLTFNASSDAHSSNMTFIFPFN